MKIKQWLFILLSLICVLPSKAQTDSLHSNIIIQENTDSIALVADSLNIQPITKNKPVINKDSIRNWNTVDSVRIKNPYYFHSTTTPNSTHPIPNTAPTNYSYYYLLFFLFVISIILYSRIVPYKFRLENSAFVSRASMSEILANNYEWLDINKVFTFLISSLFFALFIIGPLLNQYTVMQYSYIVVFISCVLFVLIFLLLSIFQIIISHTLDFIEIMFTFSRTSLNTIYILSLVGFPCAIISLSLLRINLFEQHTTVVAIIVSLYLIRTIKSLFACLRFEQRQIIYLIIYLCTLEIPMLLISIKWINNNI